MENGRRGRTRRGLDVAAIGLFLAAIVAPAIDERVRPDSVRDPTVEERTPAPRPEWPTGLSTAMRYPGNLERCYDDTFGLRDVLLRWASIVKVFGLRVSPTSRLVLGKNNFVIYTGDDSIASFRGLKPFSASELEAWRKRIVIRRDLAQRLGKSYLLIWCPSKETIYPELVPDRFNRIGPTRLDQLMQDLEAHGIDCVLDLRTALLAAKPDDTPGDELYTRYGTHWNRRGTWTAYVAIVNRLARDFPGLAPIPHELCKDFPAEGNGDTWGKRMYIDDLMPQREYVPFRDPLPDCNIVAEETTGTYMRWTQKPGTTLPRAVWFHDSFGPYVSNLLVENFSDLHAYWQGELDLLAVIREHSDLLLETYVERSLMSVSPWYSAQFRSWDEEQDFSRAHEILLPQGTVLAPSAGASVVPSDDGRVHLHFEGERGVLQTAVFQATAGADIVIRLEGQSSIDTILDFYARAGDHGKVNAKERHALPLLQGANVRALRWSGLSGPVSLLIRTRDRPADVNLRFFEIRAITP